MSRANWKHVRKEVFEVAVDFLRKTEGKIFTHRLKEELDARGGWILSDADLANESKFKACRDLMKNDSIQDPKSYRQLKLYNVKLKNAETAEIESYYKDRLDMTPLELGAAVEQLWKHRQEMHKKVVDLIGFGFQRHGDAIQMHLFAIPSEVVEEGRIASQDDAAA